LAGRKKSAVKAERQFGEVIPEKTDNEADSLREYSLEAEQVELLKNYNGWAILERDLKSYKDGISSKIAYLDPKSSEFAEARVLFIAADKVLKMVDDYANNRKRALELLERIDNTRENIILDVDN